MKPIPSNDAAHWHTTRISTDGTHHTAAGHPLYAERFDVVQKFHTPGLAPVSKARSAWHIRTNGSAAYNERYAITYGFYENRAAVSDGSQWFHIAPDGAPISHLRYAWCGNFQEGFCPARDRDGAYLYVGIDDAPRFDERWRYAGDFRDGVAVVQAHDGRSSHINTRGHLVHRAWFHDLDVFHKGWARAKDAAGWLHIGSDGTPAYRRRFVSVEPFYNGQARVELADGTLEIITPDGATVHVLRHGKGVSR